MNFRKVSASKQCIFLPRLPVTNFTFLIAHNMKPQPLNPIVLKGIKNIFKIFKQNKISYPIPLRASKIA